MEVRREILLPAAPDEVWEELTDPDRLEEWFANDVDLDLDGGAGVFRWETGEVRVARIEELDEGRRLGFRWTPSDAPAEETYVGFTLDPVEGGTRLVVTETPTGPRACAGEWAWALELRAASNTVLLAR